MPAVNCLVYGSERAHLQKYLFCRVAISINPISAQTPRLASRKRSTRHLSLRSEIHCALISLCVSSTISACPTTTPSAGSKRLCLLSWDYYYSGNSRCTPLIWFANKLLCSAAFSNSSNAVSSIVMRVSHQIAFDYISLCTRRQCEKQ